MRAVPDSVAAYNSALPSVRDLVAPGTTVLFPTIDSEGPHTRPVLTQPDPAGRADHVGVLTTRTAHKIEQINGDARVTLAGPTPAPHTGWFSCTASAAVEDVPEAMGGPDVVRIDLTLTSGRVWTVYSSAPRDNEVHEIPIV